MFTLTTERFKGWSQETSVLTLRLIMTSAYQLFDTEATKALTEDMDMYRVTLSRDGEVCREIRFEDRKIGREG